VNDEVAKFDRYAGEYRNLHDQSVSASGEHAEYFHVYKLERLERAGVQRGQRILDYGCGIGNLTLHLAERFPCVVGFDPSEKSLEVARGRVPGASFASAPDTLEDATFDVAVLSGVLHHVPRDERVGLLATVKSKLKPGGRLFVFEHNPLNPMTRRAVSACPFDDDAVLLWPWALPSLLSEAGFERPKVDYIVFFPKLLARLRPLEPRLRWLPIGAQTMTVARRA
jgi:SAM-dependent methyltransferase